MERNRHRFVVNYARNAGNQMQQEDVNMPHPACLLLTYSCYVLCMFGGLQSAQCTETGEECMIKVYKFFILFMLNQYLTDICVEFGM